LKNEKHALTTFEKMFDTNRFETILQSISDGVIAIDLDRRLTCFNTASERIFGRKREDVLGKRCDEIIQSSVCDGSCTLDYTMETGTPVVNLPIQVKNLHGEEIPVTVSTAPIRDRNGKIVGGVETLRDLNMVRRLLDEVGNGLAVRRILTADTRVKKLLEMVPMIARSESTVLIEGESGTGKGLLAQAIHEADTRRTGPLVTVNCGALPENLLESELFGYKAGAFTDAKKDKPGRVAAAKGGTLFLDEIGDLPLSLQVKILHLLQEKRYEPLGAVESVRADVRIVAATNRNLMEMMEKGTFREDLYYRINVIPLSMPPLRERKSDIPLLAESFLRGLSIARGKAFEGISRDASSRSCGTAIPATSASWRTSSNTPSCSAPVAASKCATCPPGLRKGSPMRHHQPGEISRRWRRPISARSWPGIRGTAPRPPANWASTSPPCTGESAGWAYSCPRGTAVLPGDRPIPNAPPGTRGLGAHSPPPPGRLPYQRSKSVGLGRSPPAIVCPIPASEAHSSSEESPWRK